MAVPFQGFGLPQGKAMNADERMGRLEVGLEGLNHKVEGISRKVEDFRSEVISRFNTIDAKLDSQSQATNAKLDSQSQATNAKLDRLNRNILIAGIVIFPPLLATLGASIFLAG